MIDHKIPELYDIVQHKKALDVSGRVIAIYEEVPRIELPDYIDTKPIKVFDIRLYDDQILYATPAENWTLLAKAEISEK